MEQDFENALDLATSWIKEYKNSVNNYSVFPKISPGSILKNLPEKTPQNAECFESIFRDFKNIILPGLTHWQNPKFFGLFPANTSPPAILAEMFIATLNVQCMNWIASPAATELEVRVMEWLRELFDLPKEFSGVIQDSASSSTLIATLAAREKATDYISNYDGIKNNKLIAYCSTEAHFSIEKAIKISGIGGNNLRKIPVNEFQKMRTDLLCKTIQDDLEQGLKPFFVVGAFGTTGTTAVDDLNEISQIAKKYNLWFHIDAAYAGSSLILPEIRVLAKGIEHANSIVINPHKWLLTSIDCSAFFIREKENLVRTFSVNIPEYLKISQKEENTNFSDWGTGLGRRFRALKLWFVLRWYGSDGLKNFIRNHIELSHTLEKWISMDSRFELFQNRNFNLICFRFKASNDLNMQLIQEINSTGKLFLNHTKINDKIFLRIVVGQTNVEEIHLKETWQEIQKIASDIHIYKEK
jgi:aromatic-L-amino-acid/L-tryptophan decarboxylase